METGFKAPGLKGKSLECEGLTCIWPEFAGSEFVRFESDYFAPDETVIHRIEAVVESADGEIAPENNIISATIEVLFRSPNCPSGGMDFSGMSGGGCFISTAAYGSASHADVQVLRDFRDDILLRYAWGKALVNFYYRHSHDLACAIEGRPGLQLATRSILKPIVLTILYPWWALLLLSALLLLFVWFLSVYRRNRKA